MSFAETLSSEERRRSRIFATVSALFGCISEQVIDSNTIIILYLMMLEGSASFSLFSSSISAFAHACCSIPFAYIIARTGLRKSYTFSVYLGIAAFLAMVAAPYAGAAAKYVVVVACLAYCVSRPLYSATWYPLLNNFLLPHDRVPFFGTMRVIYMLLNTCLIFLLGKLMGANPPIWILQVAIAFAGITQIGRKICMDRLPIDPDAKQEDVHFPASVLALRNSPRLIGFACLIFFLDLFVLAAIPIATIYMKTVLNLPASTIMYATSTNLVGIIIGNYIMKYIVKWFGLFKFQFATHILFLCVIGLLVFVHEGNQWNLPLLFASFLFNGMGYAAILCLGSTRQLSLGQPDNRVISMAFVTSMQNLGTFIGRTGATLALSSGALASAWSFKGLPFTHFHTMFIVCFAMTFIGLIFQMLATANADEA